jgi:SPX domain protein involved in polyphosphate accumulation
MKRTDPKEMSPLIERHEMKFLISRDLVEPISEFVSIYCRLDQHSWTSDDYFYVINSLYFDTPSFLFLRRKLENVPNRFNMRVRSYGTVPRPPYFLEIKQRPGNNTINRKFRAPIHEEDWHKAFTTAGHPIVDETDMSIGAQNRRMFFRLCETYDAAPKILIQYRRKAYFSDVDDYARVTFDMGLRYQMEETYNIRPDEDRMVPYDHSACLESDESVILELKCYTFHVPFWILDLIRCFNLSVTSFSKYATGMRELFTMYRPANMDRIPVISLS